ncbi:MAG TPA: hypothetical protein VKU41_16175, partial [Polyangiaceae bacterium]|nr:hypothetical protein [Polyangiaceae bacterium]
MRRIRSPLLGASCVLLLSTGCNAILGNEPGILEEGGGGAGGPGLVSLDASSPDVRAMRVQDATSGLDAVTSDAGVSPQVLDTAADDTPAADAAAPRDATAPQDVGVSPDVATPADVAAEQSPPPMTCPNANGLYCGGDGVGGSPDTLYFCTNGVLTP